MMDGNGSGQLPDQMIETPQQPTPPIVPADPEMNKYEPEVREVADAAKEGIEGLKEDALETKRQELREFSEYADERVAYLETIQDEQCTREIGENWRDVIAGQLESETAEA